MYEVGQVKNFFDGSVYQVERIYTLTPEYMRKFELYHPNRVAMRKISGVGPERLDFAVSKED